MVVYFEYIVKIFKSDELNFVLELSLHMIRDNDMVEQTHKRKQRNLVK